MWLVILLFKDSSVWLFSNMWLQLATKGVWRHENSYMNRPNALKFQPTTHSDICDVTWRELHELFSLLEVQTDSLRGRNCLCINQTNRSPRHSNYFLLPVQTIHFPFYLHFPTLYLPPKLSLLKIERVPAGSHHSFISSLAIVSPTSRTFVLSLPLSA